MSHSPSNSSAERQRRRRPARRGRGSLAASMATTNDEITALLEPHRHSPSPLTENDAFNISTHSASSLSSGMNYNATGTTSLRSNNSFANLTASLTASWISNSRRTSQDRPSKPRPPKSVDLYSTTLKACTENIFGLYAIEVWRVDQYDNLISMPISFAESDEETPDKSKSKTLYVRRITQEADQDSDHFDSSSKDAFERLTETSRLDYLHEDTRSPGVGLAGVLWVESSQNVSNKKSRQHSYAPGIGNLAPDKVVGAADVQTPQKRPAARRGRSLRDLIAGIDDEDEDEVDHPNVDMSAVDHSLRWRNVSDLATDPDQPYDERLQIFAKAGFTKATGIPFVSVSDPDFKGLVVFFANPHADEGRLEHPTNVKLIKNAAQCIGSVLAVQCTTDEAVAVKKERQLSNWKRTRTKISVAVRFRLPLRRKDSLKKKEDSEQFRLGLVVSMQKNKSKKKEANTFQKLARRGTLLMESTRSYALSSFTEVQYLLKSKGMKWVTKVQGGHVGVPPAFSTSQTLWSLFGSLIAHMTLGSLHYFLRKYDSETFNGQALIIGPLGALTTLQYNLTAAPASQPRNTMLSQLFAIMTAFCLHQLDISVHLRTTLAPVVVIAGTAWLGIVHPPAGAAAVSLAVKDELLPAAIVVFLVEISITVVIAVTINNLSDKRQYPTNWPILKSMCMFLLPFLDLLAALWHLSAEYLTSMMPSKAEAKNEKLTARNAFRMIDENGDGFLSMAEVASVIEMMSMHGQLDLDGKTPLEISESIFEQMDSNGDGKLSEEEFASEIIFFATLSASKEAARNAFSMIDSDGNGLLDKYEVAAAIDMMVEDGQMKLDGKSSLELAEKMIDDVDVDGNGELDVEEFAEMMKDYF